MEINVERLTNAFTSKHWRFIFKSDAECPATLLAALLQHLPHITADSWPERLAWGGVFVNGVPVAADARLSPPCQLEYFEPKETLSLTRECLPRFDPSRYVIYEDGDLIVVFKPARLSCHIAREQRHCSLFSYLQDYTGRRIHMPSRLDFSTAGLVVASKSPSMHAPLQQLFETKQIQKAYLCEVSGPAPWKAKTVIAAIDKDPRHPVLRRVVDSGGKPSETKFISCCPSSLNQTPGEPATSLIAAYPRTGRTHQIRVHLAHLGLPIVGDNFYNGHPAPELRLLSYAVEFTHPLTNERLSVRLPESLLPAWLCAKGWNSRLPGMDTLTPLA